MSDFDSVINKVVDQIWDKFDKDNSGALDKDEAKVFINFLLKQDDSQF